MWHSPPYSFFQMFLETQFLILNYLFAVPPPQTFINMLSSQTQTLKQQFYSLLPYVLKPREMETSVIKQINPPSHHKLREQQLRSQQHTATGSWCESLSSFLFFFQKPFSLETSETNFYLRSLSLGNLSNSFSILGPKGYLTCS